MNIGNEAGKKKGRRSNQSTICAVLLLLIACGLCVAIITGVGASYPLCEDEELLQGAMAGGLMGAPKEVKNSQNTLEIEEIAKFAVQEHNSKEGKKLTFKKVVTAKTQVVSGTMYHLTLEATPEASEQPKLYDAKVWTKPWESHKTLEQFKEVETSSSVSFDTQGASSLREVSVDDPVIKEAAEHAIKGLNNKSNSLVPYELKEILSAQAKAGDENTQFQLHIKVSKGSKEENVNTGLHRTAQGKWIVTTSANAL